MNEVENILERVKAWANAGKISADEILDRFPELNESEDERIRKAISYAICAAAHQDGTLINNVTKDEAFAYLEKQKEQKPALRITKGFYEPDGPQFDIVDQKPAEWSEEDKRILDEAIGMIEARGCWVRSEDAVEQVSDFLKSLPDRFNLQPKQEWSEEDDIMLNDIIRCLPSRSSTEFNLKRINWLKHFRFRSHWTPSEEQMVYLKEAINKFDFCDAENAGLQALYEQLKKL